MSDTPLGRLIADEIRAEGPISVARFMALALGHPVHGYYMTRDPFGTDGDFVTAPEVSQMFGELIGLWAVEVWQAIGAPDRFVLAELGPGRGTLMADALRAARLVPAFGAAAEVHLVETSPTLRTQQAAALAGTPPAGWHDRFEDLPDGPVILFANEFFDALPVHQFEYRNGAWHERRVGLADHEDRADDGPLAFRLSPDPAPPTIGTARAIGTAPTIGTTGSDGAILEAAPERERLAAAVAGRLVSSDGAALIIDYGHAERGFGDTLQAVRAHRFADPLANPGEADLTAHVDFASLARAAETAGAVVHGPMDIGPFLLGLGIAVRAEQLRRGKPPAIAATVDAALARLTRTDQMGSLFKVLALTAPGLPPPPPFDTEAPSNSEASPDLKAPPDSEASIDPEAPKAPEA